MELYDVLMGKNGAGASTSQMSVEAHVHVNGNGAPAKRDLDLDSLRAIILAGGRGTRLAPYTSVLPKPLMPVGDRPILEIVVDQLAATGINQISLCVGYLAHVIRAVLDQRDTAGVEIAYVHEREALGTAAPLRLVPDLEETFLVMNGDVLTTLDYSDLVRAHRQSSNVLTIATHYRTIKIDYGMLHIDEAERVSDFEEKPEIVSPVSMGIYVMEPSVLEHIPLGSYFDFPDLVRALLQEGLPIGAYRYPGPWFDIGRHEDYAEAVEAWSRLTEPHRNGSNGQDGSHPSIGKDQDNHRLNGHSNGTGPKACTCGHER
jgi:NDP-sugar pyrophosphorylase family protein